MILCPLCGENVQELFNDGLSSACKECIDEREYCEKCGCILDQYDYETICVSCYKLEKEDVLEAMKQDPQIQNTLRLLKEAINE